MYNCQICNFVTNSESSFARHMSSQSHLLADKNNISPIVVCNLCNVEFADKKKLNKHIINCKYRQQLIAENKQLSINNAQLCEYIINTDKTNQEYKELIETVLADAKSANIIMRQLANELNHLKAIQLVNESTNSKLDKLVKSDKILDKLTKLDKLDKLDILDKLAKLDKLDKLDGFDMKYINSSPGKSTANQNASVSTLNFLNMNFSDAPILRVSNEMEVGKLLCDNDNEKLYTAVMASFDARRLDKFIGGLIVSEHVNKPPGERSIWVSDTTRHTCLVRCIVNNRPEWVTDKEAVKLRELVVLPIMKYLDKHISIKMIEQAKYILTLQGNEQMCQNIVYGKIIDVLRMLSSKLPAEVIKYISPFLYADKKYLSASRYIAQVDSVHRNQSNTINEHVPVIPVNISNDLQNIQMVNNITDAQNIDDEDMIDDGDDDSNSESGEINYYTLYTPEEHEKMRLNLDRDPEDEEYIPPRTADQIRENRRATKIANKLARKKEAIFADYVKETQHERELERLNNTLEITYCTDNIANRDNQELLNKLAKDF
ncbi:MAG: zinc finger protein [Faunusvirus sp.]|jgi:hypothetical protein|uniref:Zinc finger protein n=1 Tax=Faunusvirus sp. TaxID=2487766 RepID=A0A3G4ZX24_9VIRU|nr:MAG: zinc finger protein [Faunusvirus sp.]